MACLSLDLPHDKIISGLKNFRGLPGRTNKKTIENSIIIEEINPGINTDAIKKSIGMIDELDDYYIAIGGDYGITCEEIDEAKVSQYLDTLDCEIMLTGDVGLSIKEKMTKNLPFIEDYNDCYDLAIKNNKNLLFIYRSDYRKVSQR